MQFCLATLMRIFPLLLPSSALVSVSAHSRAQSEVRELRICLSRNRNSINHHNLSPDKEPPSQFVARYATTITMCTLHTLCCEVLMSSAHSTSEVLLSFMFYVSNKPALSVTRTLSRIFKRNCYFCQVPGWQSSA